MGAILKSSPDAASAVRLSANLWHKCQRQLAGRDPRGPGLDAQGSDIKVFNTLTMQKEPLRTLRAGQVGLYVCGPTVYNYVHLGNARTFTAFDVVVRYLRYRGFEVRYVRNFTDVDDKIIQAARDNGEEPSRLANRYIQAFEEDARGLGLLAPDVSPKVTDHIPEVIQLIQRLLDAEVAYVSAGDVYFQVSRYPAYAKLSKRNLEDLRTGERVIPGEQKREPLDFALWKAAKPGEPKWEAPWGQGRPGWHIECSAMAAKYLGETFDLHGGGLDLIFPHHENELAQSEAATHKPLARVWMHANFLDLEGAKMSKSLGNVVLLRDALAKMDAEALRYFFLSTHYRNPISFSDKALADSESRLSYFYETLEKVDARLMATTVVPGTVPETVQRPLKDFEAAMDDDFNCPGAMAALSDLFAQMNEWTDKPPTKERALGARVLSSLREQASKMGGVFGMLGRPPQKWLLDRRQRLVQARGIDAARVEQLITQRKEARHSKDFARADALRQEALALGVELMDGPSGTTWKVKA